jgi:hypothetical protein
MVSTEAAAKRKSRPYEDEQRIATFKVRPEFQRAMRIRAAELDIGVSELIRRAIFNYLAESASHD